MNNDTLTGELAVFNPLDIDCCCDHLGTPRLFVGPDGKVIKEVVRSSFGKIVYDSFPCLQVPIGFAGGLEDRDTRLIRFHWRDYGGLRPLGLGG